MQFDVIVSGKKTNKIFLNAATKIFDGSEFLCLEMKQRTG